MCSEVGLFSIVFIYPIIETSDRRPCNLRHRVFFRKRSPTREQLDQAAVLVERLRFHFVIFHLHPLSTEKSANP